MPKFRLCSFSLFLSISLCGWANSLECPSSTTGQTATLEKIETSSDGFVKIVDSVLAARDEKLLEEFKSKYLDNFQLIIDKFYPSGRSISCKVFTLMDAHQIDKAIKVLVKLFDEKYWFYKNTEPIELSSIELDLLLRELEIYQSFFKNAFVYKINGKLIKKESTENEEEKALERCSLKDYFSKNLKTDSYLSLVAVRIDFLVIKMYSFGLKTHLKGYDLANYQQNLAKIETLLTELNGSSFERKYKQAFKSARDIIETFSANIEKNSPTFLRDQL